MLFTCDSPWMRAGSGEAEKEVDTVFHTSSKRRELMEVVSAGGTVRSIIERFEQLDDVLHVAFSKRFHVIRLKTLAYQEIL